MLQLPRQREFILSARVVVVTDATVTLFPDTSTAASLDIVKNMAPYFTGMLVCGR